MSKNFFFSAQSTVSQRISFGVEFLSQFLKILKSLKKHPKPLKMVQKHVLTCFSMFLGHLMSFWMVFERFEWKLSIFSLYKPIQNLLYKLSKAQNFQIAQKQSKSTQNSSKTCFNMFLSAFGSFNVILDGFRPCWKFSKSQIQKIVQKWHKIGSISKSRRS